MADSSDPFETLKRHDGDPGVPLAPAEVRARGDRMRRRRTAFRAVAAAAAVAVVTTGGVALGGSISGTSPAPGPATQQPEPSPPAPTRPPSTPVTHVAEIPADFPIAANISVTRKSPPAVLADRLEFCGEQPLAAASRVDALSAESSGGETSETRTLLLFGDAAAATGAETALLRSAAACPREVRNVVGEVELLPASGDWRGRTIRTTYGETDAKFVHVVRAGAALLLTESYLQSAPRDGLTQSRASVAPLVAAMDQFRTAPAPTAGGTASPDTPASVDIPANFPLALGYPEPRFEEEELFGPGPDVGLVREIEACGEMGFPSVSPADRLGARFTAPEDERSRLLTTYPDVETAQRVLSRVVATYQACPTVTDDLGWTTRNELRKVEPGDVGYVVIRTNEFDGAPSPGLELLYVVRVGNAVLLQSTSNEGGGNEKQIYAQVREQTQLVGELAERMCPFGPVGCLERARETVAE